MRIADGLLSDFDLEMEKTRLYLEAVPEDKATWRPHDKSMPLGELAKHLPTLLGLALAFLTTDGVDITKQDRPTFPYKNKADLLSSLDEGANKVRSALLSATDEQLLAPWSFRKGETPIATGPRFAMFQVQFLHHLIHHRAQLGVYFRLLNIEIPGLYGPSADQQWNPPEWLAHNVHFTPPRP